MICAYLILAHLIGDFVLQPSKLVDWKMKSKGGLLVHSGIHAILVFLILLPFFFNHYLILVIASLSIGFVHFIIDATKISYDIRHDKKVIPFIIDQMIHLITLVTAFLALNSVTIILPANRFYELYTDHVILSFIILAIFFTSVLAAYSYQREREKHKDAKYILSTRFLAHRVITLALVYALFYMVINLFQ